MTWPNTASWSALLDGKGITINDSEYVLSVVDCGQLALPTGRLVACDPFMALDWMEDTFTLVPAGRYPVKVTLADVSGENDGSHIREAYVTLLLSDAPEVTRRNITPPAEQTPPEMVDGEYVGFAVDGGTVCFVDGGMLADGMPLNQDAWFEEVFDSDEPSSWFNQMDDPEHMRSGIANVVLPRADDGTNIILIHSGWGDGVYPVVGGYDADGNLVRVHIDLMVIPPPGDDG